MRKLILQEHVTIDNFAADLNGGMDFQEEYSAKKDESFIKDAEAFLDTVDTMLVGATTYNFFTEYLPESKEQADSFTDKIGSLSKYVVSTELKEAPWGGWEPATIIKDNVFEEITKLKEQSGKHHVQALCACGAHLLDRVGVVLREERPYQLQDGDGTPITPERARQIIAER